MKKGAAILFLITVAAFGGAVGYPFVHDDVVFILQNPSVHDIRTIVTVFDHGGNTSGASALANPYYRPILDIYYRLGYFFFGPNSAGFHIVNILLHFINALLVYRIVNRISTQTRFAWVAAALFLVHPIQSEAVVCISGISNILFSVFFLLAFLNYMTLTAEDQDRSVTRQGWLYAKILVFFGLALLSKEQALIFPAIVLLYEFCSVHLSGRSNSGWRLRLSGVFIVAGGYLLWRKLILGGFLTSFVANSGEFILRIKAVPAILMTHLGTIFWPADLHYYRSHDILAPWVWPAAGFVFFVAAMLLSWKILPPRLRVIFSFGWGWFLITILPTTSIVPLIHEYSWVAVFEHFNYLPLVGVIMSALALGSYLLEMIFRRWSELAKKYAVLLLVSVCIFLTWEQSRSWNGEVVLFERAVKYQPRMGRLRILLARAYFSEQRVKKSQEQFRIARDIMAGYLAKVKDERVKPFYEGFLKESLFGLATCAQALGDLDGAKDNYEKMLILSPDDPALHNNLGVLAIHMGQKDRAMGHFQDALRIADDFLPARHNLEHLQKELLAP